MSKGGFTLVDFSVPTREKPVSHPAAVAPLCDDCRSLDLCFFNPNCSGCQDILLDFKTTISELFAVMRQWVPQTQRNIAHLAREVLRRGANVNDRDGLTDLTLLHYACKSGAAGVGNTIAAVNLVNSLISKGADTTLRCRWTNMNALHYAVYFDVPELTQTLLQHNPALLMSECAAFGGGNALHIAAAHLSLSSAKVLLSHRSDGSVKDRGGRLPYECVPAVPPKDMQECASELAELLQKAAEHPPPKPAPRKKPPSSGPAVRTSIPRPSPTPRSSVSPSPTPRSPVPRSPMSSPVPHKGMAPPKSPVSNLRVPVSRSPAPSHSTASSGLSSGISGESSQNDDSPSPEQVTMATRGLKLGDRIVIDASSTKPKYGTIRFGGGTEFASGQWAGVELDQEIGKNDGSYGGIRYFTCKSKYGSPPTRFCERVEGRPTCTTAHCSGAPVALVTGLFVPMHRISKAVHRTLERRKRPGSGKNGRSSKNGKNGRDSISVATKAMEVQSQLQMTTDIQIGERVMVSGSRTGVLRYTGTVKFAPGFWLGVELDHAHGKNDGSRSGVRYFRCKPNHGIFVLPSKVKRPDVFRLSSSTGSSEESVDNPKLTISSDGSSQSSHSSPPSAKRKLTSSWSRSLPRSKQAKLSSSSSHPHPHPSTGTSTSSASPTIPLSLALGAQPTLEEGMSVFVNGELAVVRYIGFTEFADGMWLGVELRRPNGKNDGSVQGKRYFTCKPSHGLFVKPEKGTHRGINCSKLIPNYDRSSS